MAFLGSIEISRMKYHLESSCFLFLVHMWHNKLFLPRYILPHFLMFYMRAYGLVDIV
jgi:hypothetical protein